MGLKNHSLHLWRRGIALLAATATLAGGVSAFAAIGGGDAKGSITNGTGGQVKWAYHDSWGGVDDNVTRRAIESMGLTIINFSDNEAVSTIHTATTKARNECNARAHAEGIALPNCRLVAVGVVHTPHGGGTTTDNYTGHAGGFTTANWENAYVKAGINTGHYSYNGIPYDTNTHFSDHATTINTIAYREMGDPEAPGHNTDIEHTSIIVIALNQNEPKPANYHLNVSTNAIGQSPQAGTTNPVHDRITASLNRGEKWSGKPVTLGVFLNWDGYPAGESRKAIQKTVTINGPATVSSPNFTPRDFGWSTWAPGRYWYDIAVGKQGDMAGGVNTPDRQAPETFQKTPPPTGKTITRMNGQKIDGQLAPGTMYMSHITGTVTPAVPGKYNTQATITDHIHSKNVWIGAQDHDDLTKVTVTHDGKTVTNGVHVSKTETTDGIDVTATISNPAEGQYTLNIPSTIKALTGNGKDKVDETIKDQGCVVANTGAAAVCTDTKQEQGEHPETSKAWQLKGGQLVEDKNWTNKVGADNLTFLPGDPVSAIVTGHIPSGLLENLDRYELTDDWSNASRYVDFAADATNPNHKVSVYVDGKDDSSEFDVHENASAHTTTIVAKKAFLDRKTIKGIVGHMQCNMLMSK